MLHVLRKTAEGLCNRYNYYLYCIKLYCFVLHYIVFYWNCVNIMFSLLNIVIHYNVWFKGNNLLLINKVASQERIHLRKWSWKPKPIKHATTQRSWPEWVGYFTIWLFDMIWQCLPRYLIIIVITLYLCCFTSVLSLKIFGYPKPTISSLITLNKL